MIYVLAGDRGQYEGFLHEFRLRTHHGDGNNREGQCRFLSDCNYDLRGIDRAIVLVWGTAYLRGDYDEVESYCTARDIPFIQVPDLRRARHYREMAATKSGDRKWI